MTLIDVEIGTRILSELVIIFAGIFLVYRARLP